LLHHALVNQIAELLDGDHHNKEIYLRTKMIGKIKGIYFKEIIFGFSSVTIERQANEIRLRIRNLTSDDQGIYHNLSIYINHFLKIGNWECIGMDSAGRQIRKSFQLIIRGLLNISQI
jgi:hypothetical protein